MHSYAGRITRSATNNAMIQGVKAPVARSVITKTETIRRLGKVFQNTVMNNSEARRHWTDVAGTETNAFMAWLNSKQGDTEAKYLGINNPKIKQQISDLYSDVKK